jgi:hypothetical protein
MTYTPHVTDNVTITIKGVVKSHHGGGLCVEMESDDERPDSACFKITPDRKVEKVPDPYPTWKNGDVIVVHGHSNHTLFRVLDGWNCTCGHEPEDYVLHWWKLDPAKVQLLVRDGKAVV